MRYGWVLPYGDARTASELAAVAEEHGWDGFFVWEGVWGIDPWISLAAVAMRTERIRMGTMLTPLPRRLPWELAGQVATLDNLSGGRVILPIGLGAADDRWWLFEDDPGRRVRAERMDEALDLIQALWSGEPVRYDGAHYRARPAQTGCRRGRCSGRASRSGPSAPGRGRSRFGGRRGSTAGCRRTCSGAAGIGS
jgi:alkanesulfonate monooxygenase SsuD/methylene tetrahydromethanopterin reductase-like flavin-dependent oxidoreductase (luciferase family)